MCTPPPLDRPRPPCCPIGGSALSEGKASAMLAMRRNSYTSMDQRRLTRVRRTSHHTPTCANRRTRNTHSHTPHTHFRCLTPTHTLTLNPLLSPIDRGGLKHTVEMHTLNQGAGWPKRATTDALVVVRCASVWPLLLSSDLTEQNRISLLKYLWV